MTTKRFPAHMAPTLRFVSIQEAHELTGLSRAELRRLVDNGDLTGHKTQNGGRYMINLYSLLVWSGLPAEDVWRLLFEHPDSPASSDEPSPLESSDLRCVGCQSPPLFPVTSSPHRSAGPRNVASVLRLPAPPASTSRSDPPDATAQQADAALARHAAFVSELRKQGIRAGKDTLDDEP